MPTVRVLLVDDHPPLRAGLRRMLESDASIEVVAEAGDGGEALELAERLRPDVVVLDMELPVLSGIEVARALKGSGMRVLALSAHTGRGFVRGLLEAGAAGYLTKDRDQATLVDAVKAVAAGEGRWLVVPNPSDDPLGQLTERERDVLGLLARGLSNEDIAETLCISLSTARNALSRCYEKLDVESAREAVAWAWENGVGRDVR